MDSAAQRVVLVTGSSSGIGRATVELFASKGFRVAICGSDATKVGQVAQSCALLSPNKLQPLSLVLDFSEPENGAVAVRTTIEHFGRLDVLVNNASCYLRTNLNDKILDSMVVYRKLLAVNVDAALKATLAAVDELRRTRGNIVFITRVSHQTSMKSSFAYNTSKASIAMLAKTLTLELSPDIRVNMCSPAFTPFADEVARRELGKPTPDKEAKEIAKAIYLIASDEAKFISGNDILVGKDMFVAQA